MNLERLLIVDGDESLRSQLRWAFGAEYLILEASTLKKAVEIARMKRPGVAIIDLGLPPAPAEHSEGLRAMTEILSFDPAVRVIAVAGMTGKRNAIEAIDMGAFDFFPKPVNTQEISSAVRRAFHLYGLQSFGKGGAKGREAEGSIDLIGSGDPMQEVYRIIRKVAPVNVPVLILGESGTGKELAANAIHGLSPRRHGPFAAINCGAIPEGLLESELFGYEKGSFTGADTRRKGKIEYVHEGTLFLDEIGELSPRLQVKLLRFLQDRTIERVGCRTPIHVDARLISATNRDIGAMVKAGTFREDLFFRLGVIVLVMPPLRQRGDDVYELSLAFLRRYSKEFNISISGFDKKAVTALRGYGWPGNVRELENKVKRAVALCKDGEITVDDLELPGQNPGAEGTPSPMGLIEAKEAFKRRMIQETLLKNRGVISRTALDLGISRQYLSKLLSKYNIRIK